MHEPNYEKCVKCKCNHTYTCRTCKTYQRFKVRRCWLYVILVVIFFASWYSKRFTCKVLPEKDGSICCSKSVYNFQHCWCPSRCAYCQSLRHLSTYTLRHKRVLAWVQIVHFSLRIKNPLFQMWILLTTEQFCNSPQSTLDRLLRGSAPRGR